VYVCLDTLFFFSLSLHTLYVSGGFSFYHQELKTAHTASGICQTNTATADSLTRLAAGSSNGLTNTG